MLELLVILAQLLVPDAAPDVSTYVIGTPYDIVETGCQEKEDSLTVARTYRDAGRRVAWKTIIAMSERKSSNGLPACGEIHGGVIFTSQPAFEADVDTGSRAARRLSVVHAHTANANSYWLLMLDSRFVQPDR
jgi:hypothetical protein